jgi:HAD superfamily hydrolase (TIGR01509 family)
MTGAIFDVDGTLLDSMSAWWNVMIEFFENNNLTLTDEKAAEYKEMTLEESVPSIINEFQLDMMPKEIILEFQKMIVREYRENIQLKPYVAEYLMKLHNSGVKIAIATSGYESLCKSAFERLGVWKYIDACAFSSEVGVNKGNPDIYLLAAERLGVNPTDCIVYEDIVLGINGAKKGGFKTCAIRDLTNLDETEELKNIADKYIESWEELL